MKEIEKALERASTTQNKVKPTQTEAEPIHTPQAPPTPAVSNSETGKGRQEIPLLRADFDQFEMFSSGASKRAQVVDGAFRVLRTQVLDAMQKRNLRVIGITSPHAGAGKTVTAIKLALACARREEQSIVLADFDFRRPAVAKYLGADGFQSTIRYFQGLGTVQDYISTSEEQNLRFFLTDEPSDMSAEFLAGPRMEEALKTMTRDRSTAVIVDLPPIIGCDDTIAMMPRLDGVILVVESGVHAYELIERTARQIPKDKLIASVLNKVPNVDVRHAYTYKSYKNA